MENSNKGKIWLIASISVVIVVVLFLVLYTPARVAIFGKAIDVGWGADRTIVGNQVTLTITPTNTDTFTIVETITGATITPDSWGTASCGLNANVLICDFDGTTPGTIVYQTSGVGTVTGDIWTVDPVPPYVADSQPITGDTDILNCVDADGDSYGVGPDCAGTDCDDNDATKWQLAYQDSDMDSYGNPLVSMCVGLSKPNSYVWDNTDCDDTNININPAAAERCDGIDNNCDGQTDVGCLCVNGETQDCGVTEVGECTYGTQTCDINGDWGLCIGEITAVPEICDGLDNDCDTEIDEDFNFQTDDLNCGTCGNDCLAIGKVCQGGVCVFDTCQGDNDGDGYGSGADCLGPDCNDNNNVQWQLAYLDADDDLFGNPASFLCVGATLPPNYVTDNTDCDDSNPDSYPGALEICDAEDNDCDTQIDEGITCLCINGETQPCGSDIGECIPGNQICINGNWGPCGGAVGPSPEVCDGLDNDCDGIVDNGASCVISSQVCHVGACRDKAVALADTDSNGCIDSNEYNNFKGNYKNNIGGLQGQINYGEYTIFKYKYRIGLISC